MKCKRDKNYYFSIWRKKRNTVLEKFENNHQNFLVSQSDNYPTVEVEMEFINDFIEPNFDEFKLPKSQSDDLKCLWIVEPY